MQLELMEQFRDKVLPMFTVRNIESSLQCVPHQQAASYSLSFDVFAPAKNELSPKNGLPPKQS